jgi:hypothetical protein
MHINIEQDTTPCTTDLQKPKFTNIYKTEQLCWELNSGECGEGLADVKSEGANIERVWCTAAGYR